MVIEQFDELEEGEEVAGDAVNAVYDDDVHLSAADEPPKTTEAGPVAGAARLGWIRYDVGFDPVLFLYVFSDANLLILYARTLFQLHR